MLGSANQNHRLYAQQHIRRMRGGSQSHLMRASDGGYWIVKFTNNAQHVRVLANEFLASRIGRCLGLPIPEVNVIEVSDWLVQNSPELHVECAGYKAPFTSGLQLASRYVADPQNGMVFDYLPENMFQNIDGLDQFSRVLILDKWTCKRRWTPSRFHSPIAVSPVPNLVYRPGLLLQRRRMGLSRRDTPRRVLSQFRLSACDRVE